MSRVQAVTIRFRQSDTAVAKEDLVLQKYGNCCGRLNYAYRVQEVVGEGEEEEEAKVLALALQYGSTSWYLR
jgi:hypothetical protein